MRQLLRAHRHHGERCAHVARGAAALARGAGGAAPLHQRVVHERLQQRQQRLAAAPHGAQHVLARQPEYTLRGNKDISLNYLL